MNRLPLRAHSGVMLWIAIGLLLIPNDHAAAQEAVGVVYRASEGWIFDDGVAVEVAAPVSATDRIRAPTGADVVIVLWLPQGRVECTARGCEDADRALSCFADGAVVVGRCMQEMGSEPSGLFAAVTRWFQQQPRRLVPLASRDFGFPADAIAGLSEGRADLTRAFAGTPPNRYRLCMKRLHLEDATSSCDQRLNLEWSGDGRVYSEGNLVPGLYEMSPLPPDGRGAWVLVIDGERASIVRGSLEEARQAAEDLGVANVDERQTFERAYLMYLAAQQGVL